MAELRRDDFAGNRRLETPAQAMRFRYGYICRLIDDRELEGLPESLRSRTRNQHKAAYWKSLSLLRRDAERVLKMRRERMAAFQAWDFQVLLNDYTRIQALLGKLTLAGIGHSIHLGAGLESARQALREFETILTPGISSAALAPST
jgi:hypothetical protein